MSESTASFDRVLVIGAHPDDPEFGCAGTVLKWSRAGRHITYLLLTSGDKGSHDPTLFPGRLAITREEEQRAAAAALGVEEVVFLHRPDGLLENNLDLRREMCAIIRQRQPDIIVTIDPWRHYQLHPDHRAAGQAALDAVYAAREWYLFPEQLLGDAEPWRVREAYLFWTDNADYFEDITDCLDGRLTALARHASQIGDRLESLSERIRTQASEAGQKAGLAYAEGFKRIKF